MQLGPGWGEVLRLRIVDEGLLLALFDHKAPEVQQQAGQVQRQVALGQRHGIGTQDLVLGLRWFVLFTFFLGK